MSRRQPTILTAILGGALVACGPAPTSPGASGVRGTLTVGTAGEALAGALVQALNASGAVAAQTRTDAGGHYSLPLGAGSYTLRSAGQTLTSTVNQGGTGALPFAASQVVGVSVLDQSVTVLDFIQSPAVAGSNGATPPTLSVSGLGSTLSVQSSASFGYSADSAGGNSLTRILASFGQVPVRFALGQNDRAQLLRAGPSGEAGPTTHVQDRASLNLAQYAAGLSGSTALNVLVTDSNNNRSLYLFPLTLTNTAAGSDLISPVQRVNAVAYTVANTRLNAQSAPGGALVYSEVSWAPFAFPKSPNAGTVALNQGYHIYRSLNGGPSTLVGRKAVYFGTGPDGQPAVVNPTSWQDTDAALAPGVRASYHVRAFDGGHETPDSAPVTTTALPVLSVRLTAPSEGAGSVGTTPTFAWQTNGVGAYEYFVPALSDTVNGAGVSGCGVLPTSTPASVLIGLLQQAAQTSTRGFAFSGTQCGVVGGAAAKGYSFNYQPSGNFEAVGGGQVRVPLVFPLQEGRSYQWRLLEAVATDDPANPHALSVAFDAAGLLFHYNLYDGLYTFDGDQVYTFTTKGNP